MSKGTLQPNLNAFEYQSWPYMRPARRTKPGPTTERHAPSPWDATRCAHCGFAWDGHPESVRTGAPSSSAPGVA